MQPRLRRHTIDATIVTLTLIGSALLALLYFCFPDYIPHAIVTGLLLYLGTLLPRMINRDKTIAAAAESKRREWQRWGFYGRDREGPWLNSINRCIVKYTDATRGMYFYAEWLIIHDGYIIVNPGHAEPDRENKTVRYDFSRPRTYAWDGCTPKVWLYWVVLLGTPDWWLTRTAVLTVDNHRIVTRNQMWQLAHHASLIHDALYQYIHITPLSKAQADQLFYDMLKQAGMLTPLAFIYYCFVKNFGARDVNDRLICRKNSDYRVSGLPHPIQISSGNTV